MKTPSGILHVVDFKTEQIVSAIQPKDYWDDKRHWEIKNNVDTLDFKVFDNMEHAATLMQQNLVLKEVRDGRIVPYVITESEKDSNNRSVITYASGEWVLLAKAGIIKPQRIESKTVNEFMDMALAGTKWKRGKTEYTGFHTMTIDEFIDPLKFLKDIASLFDLEIQYRAEVVGSQIVGRYVDMVKRRGRDTGKEVTLGKDLKGVKRIENSQNICTALVGFVKGEGDEVITVESINNGLPYIVDNDAFQRWSENGQHKFGFYTPETEDLNMSPQRLMTLMKIELKKRVNASVSYEVDAASIGRIFGLSHELINEGDTLYIKDTGFTPKLYLEARAIAADESYTNPEQDKYTFGDYREIVDPNEELRRLYNKILGILGDKANKELLEQLEKLVEEAKGQSEQAVEESEAAKQLAEKVLENIKNFQTTIIESKTPPTDNLEAGKTLWLDISNGKPGILKKWSGMEWEVLIPNYGEDVKELDERTAKFETSMNGLNSTVEQLSITTKEQQKQILDAHSKIEQTSQSIEGKVDIKQVEDYVGGIGNINKLRNTEFRKNTNFWLVNQTYNIVRDVNTKYRGSISLKTIAQGNTSNVFVGAEQTVDITAGATVVASAYFKTDNPSGMDQGGTFEIKFYTANGTFISKISEEIKLLKDQWTRVVVSGIAPAGTAKVMFRYNIIRNGTLWMAQPMLQEGSIPSSYLENPNDFADKDKIMEDLADKIATEQYTQKVIDLQRQIAANTEGILLAAKSSEVYTRKEADGTFAKDAYVKEMEGRLAVTEKEIISTVRKGNIISEINQTSEKIKIAAKFIDLVGQVEASWIKAGLLQGTTVKTSNTNEHIYMQNQVLRFVNQGNAKIVIGFEDERQSKTFNPYIVLGEGDGTGRNFGTIYKDGNGVYYRFVDSNGAESSVRLTAMGNVGITAQNDMYHTAKNIFLDGKTVVTINNNGKNVASFKAANGGGDCDIYLGSHTIRSSTVSGYDQLLQIKNLMGNGFKGIEVAEVTAHGGIRSDTNLWAEKDSYAMQHINRSTEKIKTSVHDLPFSALEKIRELKVKQYFLKRDMYELYKMRMNKPANQIEPYTTNDIETQYGFIAEESDDIFTTPEKDGIKLYSTLSILTAAVQELEEKHDKEIKGLEEKHNAEMNVMNQRIETLEALVQKLINEKTEQ
ncbi:phage tail spike protein [Bacillus sp. JJ1127]|uniref:phage tail spike protein n=1 Tax=Bacillus sp. JJ1127 TaxID=3122952 RepID=UPI002FFF8871